MRIPWPTSIDASERARPREASTQLVFAGLLALSVALYFPVLRDYFISDDFVLVRFVRTWDGSWLDFLVPWRMYSDAITSSRYKPFFVYWLLAEDVAFGDGVLGRHLLNVVAHASVAAGVFVLVRKLTNSSVAGLVSALLFVSSRLHSQAVSWISAGFHLVSAAMFVWGLVALHGSSRSRALLLFGVPAAAGFLADPELVVATPVVILLALHHRFGSGGDRSRAGTVAWGALIMVVLTLGCAIANLISMRHFPDEGFGFHPKVGRFALIFLDLFAPFDVPLPMKALALLVIAGACLIVARKTPLPALMLLAAVPAALLWSSLGSYEVTPRHLYLPAVFTAVAAGQIAWLLLRPVMLGLAVSGLVIVGGVAMRQYDFVLLEGRAEIGARLREEQLAARAAGEPRCLWVQPRVTLTPEDLKYFAPELEFVDGPVNGARVIDSGEHDYERRLGPGFANSYWPWPWFSSASTPQ